MTLINAERLEEHRHHHDDHNHGAHHASRVLERITGKLTYRMFDYYVRQGAIPLDSCADGPGTRREITPAEEAALEDFAAELAAISARRQAVTNGEYFRERVAYHGGPPLDYVKRIRHSRTRSVS